MSITLRPLPYLLSALEPYISRRTLTAHHGAYVAISTSDIEDLNKRFRR